MKKNYLKINLLLVILFFLSIVTYSQNGKSLWKQTTKDKVILSKKLYEVNEPVNVSYYELDLNGLKNSLIGAPQRGTTVSNIILDFPNIDGEMESFRIEEASNMEPELQAQFPDIRSYVGIGISNPAAILRFSLSPEKGLSSMVLSENKTVFIEPYSENLLFYRVYKRTSEDVKPSQFICETEFLDQDILDNINSDTANSNADDGILRTFRLALACTGEYAAFHGGTVPNVVAAMNTTMTRVNGVFERDVAIRMVLVANNTNVIYLNAATDPYTDNNGGAMLDQNQAACNTNIGSANYDIGHVFSTGGGGIAQLNSPCGTGKARGVTGQPAPVGDFFDIDYVAHEMGHQYGANHTQNNNCQRSAKSFEPGSASTIMGYAGICAPNVQNNSDDYFHGESIREMWNNISVGNSQCAAQSATNNSAPVANAGADYTIPRSTPFVLRGSATDANPSNVLTYCWEQLDATPAQMPPVSTSTVGPAFRSLDPTISPNRYMPAFNTVLAGLTSSTWEVVPSVGRTMNFDLTVRDNVANGGSTSSDAMIVTTVGSAGPFVVTSQNSNVTWEVGSNQIVTWNVAGTNIAPISTANVNILLSINGGTTFPYTLATNVPNDGSHSIVVPVGTNTTQARIIVEAANNIFYNVNSTNFTIVNTEFVMSFAESSVTACQPNNAVYNFTYNTFSGFSETTTFSATGLPAGANVVFSPATATSNGTPVTMTVSNIGVVVPGSYTITVVGTATSTTKTADVNLTVYGNTLPASTLLTPANAATEVPATETLTWNGNANAENYLVEVSTNASFTNIVNSGTVTSTSFVTSLGANTQYFWRVTASNTCATAPSSAVFTFTTENITCDTFTAVDTPISINPVGTNLSYTSIINIEPDFPITDVNVKINIPHTWVNDLDITLTSPQGTVILLTSDNGANGAQNYTNTVFDQQATLPITGASAPFTGSFIPEGNLSSLNGQMSGGNWTLTVVDDTDQDGGTINEFTIDLCVEGSLSLDENIISEFLVFPNPNKGEFTVKLNSTSGEDIKIEVYDIRGRKIFSNKYNSISNFNQVIRLNNVQSGMYLVNVNDGRGQVTKKIIVE
uniref:reprolysin-like metallopeptidase n=1 Tax=Gelidibacter sp. TaxID=2018083 RepID=UPI00404A043A